MLRPLNLPGVGVPVPVPFLLADLHQLIDGQLHQQGCCNSRLGMMSA